MAIDNHSYDQPKSYDIRRLLVAHDDTVDIDDKATTMTNKAISRWSICFIQRRKEKSPSKTVSYCKVSDNLMQSTKFYSIILLISSISYISYVSKKNRAAEVEKKQAELNKQTTKTTLSGLNHSYKGKTSLATAA